jgi:hypothetical protein
VSGQRPRRNISPSNLLQEIIFRALADATPLHELDLLTLAWNATAEVRS